MGYLEICVVFKIFLIFFFRYLFVIDFWYNFFFIVREFTLYDFIYFKFVAVCFMSQDMIYLGGCFICTCTFSCYGCSINIE